jgi:hypothetical protein
MSSTLHRLLGTSLVSIGLLAAQAGQAQSPISTSKLRIAFSGLVFNRAANTFNTTATITNISTGSFTGALSLELPNINPATVQLANATCLVGQIPVLVLELPQAGLAPGAKLGNIVLKFSDPSLGRFTFGSLLFAGDLCVSDNATSFHALSDSRTPPDPAILAQLLPVLTALDCLPVAQPNPMSVGNAMTSIRSQLDQIAGPGAVEKFLSDNAGTDVSKLAALAGGAMATNQAPGALAALLAAHQNEPTNAFHLVNAAGAAALLAMPNEAIALLDAADALGGDFGSPMGFDGHAIALNNRAFALLQLGEYAQAQPLLVAANAREPYLAEARVNLAVAELCQGQNAAATFLSALHRSPGLPTLDQAFDLSQGVAPNVPRLQYPGSANLLRAYANAWAQIAGGVVDKATAANNQRDQAKHQLDQEYIAHPWPTLTNVRIADIADFGDELGTPTFDERSPPGLSDLYAVVAQSDTKTFNLYQQINTDFDNWFFNVLQPAVHNCQSQNIALASCQPYLQALNSGRNQVRQYLSPFLAQEGAYEQAVRAFADPWYRTLTGLAANLSDPYAHQWRSSQAEADWFLFYYGLVNRGAGIMGSLATWWEDAQAPEDMSGPTATEPTLQSSDACSGLLKAAKLQGTLFDAVSVNINCEKVTAELSEPGLGPFLSLDKPRSGDWTVFMGVKGSIPGFTGKFGVYIRGNDQSFTDAGIKSAASIGSGPLKVQSPFDMELGVADAMKCPLGFCD